jgi:hypothetical protein
VSLRFLIEVAWFPTGALRYPIAVAYFPSEDARCLREPARLDEKWRGGETRIRKRKRINYLSVGRVELRVVRV